MQQIDGCPDATLSALEARRLHERFGVQPDPTSSTVLTLGLPAQLMHHADFDSDGIAMHDHLAHAYGVEPWRFDASAYVSAAARHRGTAVDAGEHVHRTKAFKSARVHVVEELVLDELLSDLRLVDRGHDQPWG